jgi:hypothetical protein
MRVLRMHRLHPLGLELSISQLRMWRCMDILDLHLDGGCVMPGEKVLDRMGDDG